MRNVYITVIVLCFLHFVFIVRGQDWKPVNTPTGLGEVKDMITFKGNLFISTSPTVYRSENHGASWEPVTIPYTQYYCYLVIFNGELFIISQKYVARSTDGFNWNFEGAATPDVHILDVTTNGHALWAATIQGLYSSLDGVTWDKAEDLTSDGFLRITGEGSKLFAKPLWDGGKIAYSTDGGLNWDFRTVGINTFFNRLDYNDGVLFASGDEMWRSTNDGVDWVKVRGSGMFFSSESACYHIGNSVVSMSYDNGSTWSEKASQLPPYFAQVGAALDERFFIGVKGGGIYTCSIADPATWEQVNGQLRHLKVADFEYHKESLFMALESQGVLSSDDEGQTWTQRADATLTLNADVRFLQTVGNDLFAVDNASVVFRSSDNGQSWLNLGTVVPTVGHINRIGSYKTWIVIARPDGVYISKDRGESWIKSPGISGSIEWITSDNNHLLCGGPQGLMRYNPFAETWTSVPVDPSVSYVGEIVLIGDVIFLQTNIGLLRSKDYGQTWTTVDSESSYYQFSSRHTSLYRNRNGQLSQSLDSGATWHSIRDSNHGPASPFGFSRKNIFASFYDRVWYRAAQEFAPPFVESDTAFSADEPIVITFDHEPFTLSGNPLTQDDLDELITIFDSENNEVEFEAILGTDHLSITIVISNAESGGSYTVTIAPVQSASGIKGTGQTITVKATAVILSVGEEPNATVEVYPNPFSAELTISLNGTNAPLRSVTIFDALGRPIRKINAKGALLVLDDLDLGSGVYFIKVLTGKSVYQRSVLKK